MNISNKKDNNDYCRLCFTNTKKNLKPIDEKTKENFYSLTNVELITSSFYSNLICLQCDKKVEDTREYCDSIKNHELQLIAIQEKSLLKDEGPSQSRLVFVDSPQFDMLACEIKEEKEENFVIEEVQTTEKVYDPSSEEEIPPPKKFSYPRSRKKKNENREPQVYICDNCGDKFNSRSTLYNHLKRHFAHLKALDLTRPKAFMCDICGMNFRQASLLKDHIAIKHQGHRLSCPNCDAKYMTQYALKRHIENSHEVLLQPCPVCGIMKNAGDQMKRHMRHNHSTPKYQCKYCPKRFRVLVFLRNHEKVHTNTRDFVCQICTAAFTLQRNLDRHMNIKHRKQKFYCEVAGCSSATCNKANLKCHLRTVHKDLTADELKRILEKLSKMKPKFTEALDDEDE